MIRALRCLPLLLLLTLMPAPARADAAIVPAWQGACPQASAAATLPKEQWLAAAGPLIHADRFNLTHDCWWAYLRAMRYLEPAPSDMTFDIAAAGLIRSMYVARLCQPPEGAELISMMLAGLDLQQVRDLGFRKLENRLRYAKALTAALADRRAFLPVKDCGVPFDRDPGRTPRPGEPADTTAVTTFIKDFIARLPDSGSVGYYEVWADLPQAGMSFGMEWTASSGFPGGDWTYETILRQDGRESRGGIDDATAHPDERFNIYVTPAGRLGLIGEGAANSYGPTEYGLRSDYPTASDQDAWRYLGYMVGERTGTGYRFVFVPAEKQAECIAIREDRPLPFRKPAQSTEGCPSPPA